MIKLSREPFHWLTTSVMVGFTVVVLSVFLADFLYIDLKSVRFLAGSPEFRQAFVLTFVTSCITAGIATLVGIPTAYALSRYRFRGIVFFDTLVDVLIVLPVLIIGVSLLVFFKVGSELVNSSFLFLRYIGIFIKSLSEYFVYTRAGIVLAQFFCATPFAIRIMKTSFDEVSERNEDVARTLGCTPFGAFWHVALPLARNGILAGIIIGWMQAFGVFGAVTMVAGAVRGRTEVLPTSIFLEVSIGRIELALVISIVMMVTAATLLICLRALAGRSLFRTERKP